MTYDPDHDGFLLGDFLTKAATYTPTGGVAKSIRVLLTLGVEDLQLEGGLSPQTILGLAGCKASDVDGIKTGEILEIDSITYSILKVESDETGWMTLQLGENFD